MDNFRVEWKKFGSLKNKFHRILVQHFRQPDKLFFFKEPNDLVGDRMLCPI